MFVGITIERSKPDSKTKFQWKPGKFESTIVKRYWWLWFAISVFKIDEYTLATKEFWWID